MPARQRRVGLQELGLPYAADPAVTRHLARFLARQAAGSRRAARGPARAERARVSDARAVQRRRDEGAGAAGARRSRCLSGWLQAEGFAPLDARHVLERADLDHAVARGAASYGLARRGRGIRIRSGAPRTYYVGIESAMPAVPGMPAPLKALVRRAVRHGGRAPARRSPTASSGWSSASRPSSAFSRSTVRKRDPLGALIEDWGDDLEELSPLEVTLHDRRTAGRRCVPVTLESRVTEIGTHGALVRVARRAAALEARAEHPGARALNDAASGVVGIDLGTTNSALASAAARGPVRVFDIPQLAGAGRDRPRPDAAVLPLLPDAGRSRAPAIVPLPWNPRRTSSPACFARDHGALVPARQISSAKSWLSNAAVDRARRSFRGATRPAATFAGRCVGAPPLAHARRLEHEQRRPTTSLRLERSRSS